jgi:hypothetical protein
MEELRIKSANSNPDLKQEMNRFRTRLLANVVINGLIPATQHEGSLLVVLVVTALLSLGVFLITTLVSKVVSQSPPVLVDALLASMLTAFSFAIIKILHDGIFPQRSLTFPESLPELARDEHARREIARWFRSFLRVWKQLLVSALFGVAGIGSLLAFARYAGSNFSN